jgi:hypothetical protein
MSWPSQSAFSIGAFTDVQERSIGACSVPHLQCFDAAVDRSQDNQPACVPISFFSVQFISPYPEVMVTMLAELATSMS